jgi:hypothetical protein
MLERVIKNPKTTLLAGILFVSALALVWFEKATLTEAAVFLPAIVGLLWAHD